ncbi:MAG: TIM barrel protein [Alistipes communis]
MKHIVFFLTAALLLNASCGSSDEGGKTDPPAAPVPVAPTTELGKADEAIENLQLKPGKLISINQVNAANCRRAVAAGMCIDIMASDKIVFASDMTDERLDGLFAECGEAIRSTKADFWGLHLPYQTYDISSTNENTRVTAVLKLKRLIELTIEHLRPQHFVIHPNTGTILTTGGDFAERTAQSRKSLAELQRHIESCNAQHGTKAILCVENCARSLAYDGDSLLDLLDAEGLEKVRVCLDTGHALIPLNGKYIDPCATATHSTCSAASAPVWEPCTSSRTRAHSIRPIPRTSTSNLSPAD